jgi:integrase
MPAIKRKTLTLASIKSAKPAAAPYRLWDAHTPGLALRVLPSGMKTFEMRLGRGTSEKLGRWPTMTLDGARAQAQAAAGHYVVHGQSRKAKESNRKADTFRTFLDETYGPWVTAERKWGEATIANLKAQFGDFLDKPLTAFSAFGIERFKAKRLTDGIKPATVNRDLVRIKAALAKAVEWKLLEEHPLRSVKRAKGDDDSRVRYLSVDEEKRLRDALEGRESAMRKARLSGNAWNAERGRETRHVWKADEYTDHLRPFVLTAMNTGLRRGELFSLEWRDVDLGRNIVTVRPASAKSGKARHVPLNTEARAALKQWKKQGEGEGLVFPGVEGGRMTNINKSWAGLMTDAKLKDFRTHDLRHHFASKLVMGGVDLYTVKELLGHSDFAMTQRYAHLAPEHKAAAVEKLVR